MKEELEEVDEVEEVEEEEEEEEGREPGGRQRALHIRRMGQMLSCSR